MPDWFGLAFLGAVGLLCLILYVLDVRKQDE
ncbi:hypothetical protein POP15_070 [Pectobacterium phage POP15]|nr:hypothetical protein POP15_070 [Pectobacterium phage POP15]